VFIFGKLQMVIGQS